MNIIGNVLNPSLAGHKVSVKDAPTLCSLRVKKVQSFLKEQNLDGVLAINGVDSRYNPDCKRFINFLLFGCSIYKAGNFVKDGDYNTDEFILLIKQAKVHVYLDCDSLDSLHPFLTKIPNLEIHHLDSSISDDESVIEDHKVYSFIAMTSDVLKIAMPFSSIDRKLDPMTVEKWPLIQAYALENYGSQGFFGLSHELIGVDFEANDVFSQFDAGSLRHVLIDTSILLKYQWNLMIKNVLTMISSQDTFNLSKVIDPITTYLLHGGKGNSDNIAFKFEKHAISAKPLFLTCMIQEPKGSLGCGRTYFIHDNIDASDLIVLSAIYDAMVITSLKSIQRFTSTQSSAKLLQYFTKKFAEKLSGYKYPQIANFNPKSLDIKVSVNAFDVRGKAVDPSKALALKTFSVQISNIKSLENPDAVYESLVFKETFVDSRLNVKNEEMKAMDTEYIIVTSVIPTHIQWNLHHKGTESGTPCSLFSNDSDTYEASLQLTDNTVLITSPFSTPIQIRISDIKDVKIKKTGSVAIAVHIEHTFNCLPPFFKRFCLVFWQRGKGFKYATEILVPAFKEHEVTVISDNIPSDIMLKFENLVAIKSSPADNSKDQLKLIQSSYPTYPAFAPHFMLGSLGDFTYSQADVNPALAPAETVEPYIFVTIMIGIPGSNQEKVCSLVTESSKDENQFVVLRQPLGSEKMFCPLNLQKALHTLSHNGKPCRVMVIISAYIELPEVVTAIIHHPHKLTRQSCHVSCLNTCIDVRNMFICNQTWFPKILEQCQEGWVNNIVVSGIKSSNKDENLKLIRKLNSSCNIIEVVGNSFIGAEGIEEICALDSFSEPPLPISRHLTAPGWYSLKYVPSPPFLNINYISLRFDGDLCKARFMAHLKSLHQKEGRVFVDRLVMAGSIFYLCGRTKFSEDRNVYSIESTPRSDAISLNVVNKTLPKDSQNTFIFTGYQITEKQVRAWLQGCVPRPPGKKEIYSKSSLTSEEKGMLMKEAGKAALPEGWFYNGSQYVSMMGDKRMEHPHYDQILKKFLEKKNREIEEFNKQVEQFKVISLFDGM